MTRIVAPRSIMTDWEADEVVVQRTFDLDGGSQLAAAVALEGDRARILLVTDAPGELWLHWAVAVESPRDWQLPDQPARPAGSRPFDDRALRSPFMRDEQAPVHRLELVLPHGCAGAPRAINFVLYDQQHNRWLKHRGRDLHLAIPRVPSQQGQAELQPIIERIVEGEAGDHSWTLMHRFNLCCDLLDELAEPDIQVMSLVYVWLRYSAMRQLDWQRNYNTQPRELAHAQDRLTGRLAQLYDGPSETGQMIRRALATVGRGGQGQQIRDQILHIMHRNHIKEAHGTWMEQWHQKLHNNTTPDDITICRAYLAFLRSNGDIRAYDRALDADGIDRERLAGFERPITIDPLFYGDKKDALIGEFEHFLRLLRSVHSGTDLETSLDAAHHCLDHGFRRWIKDLLYQHPADAEHLRQVIGHFTDARQQLGDRLARAGNPAAVRDILYVDLGIETQVRKIVEGFPLARLDPAPLVKLTCPLLANLLLDQRDDELALCCGQWRQLETADFTDRWTLLRALGATERTTRAVQRMSDRLHALIQPNAEALGTRCGVDAWTIPIFSEEVIRGSVIFVLSRTLRRLDPILRTQAHIGGWQIVSPGQAVGRLRVIASLRTIQDRHFTEPTIVIADEITGDEEIPAGVRAVLTSQVPDLVSHVAVRARNNGVLLAGCLDEDAYAKLRGEENQQLTLHTTPSGDVAWQRGRPEPGPVPPSPVPPVQPAKPTALAQPVLEADVLSADHFAADRVGPKANNLAKLAGRLPPWVGIPPSIALTFGNFEATLADKANAQLASRYRALVKKVDDQPARTLAELRQVIRRLKPMADLQMKLTAAARRQGLTLDGDFAALFRAITAVWASQWTGRAYRSRKRRGIDHQSLRMAVLIQQVVEADQAFVLHTANPMTGNRDQIYGEVVAGLGETLVGNYPGRPLSFVAGKEPQPRIELLSFPSKSVALRGRGVICRSDSNGEDLARYAGAGLYESVLMNPPARTAADYTREKFVVDHEFRDRLLAALVAIAVAIERACAQPQDIEGAVAADHYYALQTRPQVGLESPE